MATREVSVVPKTTAVSGLMQRAVESTYPCASEGGAAVGAAMASGIPMATSAVAAAAAATRPDLRNVDKGMKVLIATQVITRARGSASDDAELRRNR